MHRGSRIDGRVAIVLIALLAVAPLSLGGCGSSGSDDGGGGGSGPFAVSATPPGGAYGSPQQVFLTATGQGSSGATLYYTLDLSVPDDTSPVYTGPFLVDTNTVVKFFAMSTGGAQTAVVTEGYTFSAGDQWAQSGHGDITAEAWRHWDEDGEVQTSCAKCHAAGGFVDWAEDGVVDDPAPLPMGLECYGCHAGTGTLYDDLTTYMALDHVEFPSGDTVTLAGNDNLCIACHQGRASMVQIDKATPNDAVQEPTDYDSFDFINIHYYAAAASFFGREVRGGYQYLDSKEYESRNTFPSHPDSLSTCVGCHMREGDANHTWLPDIGRCLECHDGNYFTTLSGSPSANYQALQTAIPQLYAEIQDYAANTLGYPVVYDSHAYPYWFNDNGQGATYANRYRNFDFSLLAAAYNYQFALKEPCGYLHNGTYMRQILHDAIEDLGGSPTDIPPGRPGYTTPVDLFVAKTNEFHLSGHDDSGGEAFRHWDEDAAPQEVPTSCARCHTSPGFADWALDGTVDEAVPPLSVVGCIACHQQANLYDDAGTRWDDLSNVALRPVEFPSGLTADLGNASNVCMGCHQGRESGPDVEAVIAADPPPYSFINIHYYPAAATFFGTQVKGGVQYRADGQYAGPVSWPGSHDGAGFTTCTGCHMIDGNHTFLPQLSDCAPCHGNPPAGWKDQFGGSPAANYTEIQSLLTDLYALIQDYATNTIGTGIQYDASAYPYWFVDGAPPIYPNRYTEFDATLLRAAYNYQMARKDPCGYMHNADYVRQILYDSLDDLDDGAQNDSVAGHTRP